MGDIRIVRATEADIETVASILKEAATLVSQTLYPTFYRTSNWRVIRPGDE